MSNRPTISQKEFADLLDVSLATFRRHETEWRADTCRIRRPGHIRYCRVRAESLAKSFGLIIVAQA